MPTIGVGRDALFEALGAKFTEDEFQEVSVFLPLRVGIRLHIFSVYSRALLLGCLLTADTAFLQLCFEFGIELDEVVEEEIKTTKTRAGSSSEGATETVYKI